MDEQRVPSADQRGKTRRTKPGAGWSPSCHRWAELRSGEGRAQGKQQGQSLLTTPRPTVPATRDFFHQAGNKCLCWLEAV